MPFLCVFIPSGWVAPYPTAGYRRTHSLGRPLPIRWVQSHFFAGYDCTSSLGTKHSILSFTALQRCFKVSPFRGVTLKANRKDYWNPSTLDP